MLGGKLFQLPEADFTKFVGASDFHGERGAPQIHLFRVRERARQIVKRGQANVPAGSDQNRKVLGVRIRPANEPTQNEGIDKPLLVHGAAC